ncbi:hypothetical protein E2542_SST07221 [Spatholobus suberectus]|nr:hypothetical protein E2542_SST07221 [Spatholobus suberectus]
MGKPRDKKSEATNRLISSSTKCNSKQCYIDPSGHKFYSQPEVLRYLETVNSNRPHFQEGKYMQKQCLYLYISHLCFSSHSSVSCELYYQSGSFYFFLLSSVLLLWDMHNWLFAILHNWNFVMYEVVVTLELNDN